MWFTRAGASARAYSSAQMICCARVAPRPPCSTGHPSPMNPARPSSRSQRDAGVEPEVLVARTAASAQLGVLADHVLGEPLRDVAAELLVVVGDLDVRHGDVRHREADGAPRISSIRTPSGSIRNTMSVPRFGARRVEDERSVLEHPLGRFVDVVARRSTDA